MYNFHVPSGIGDVSWIYSKLKCLGKNLWTVADGWPHRTAPFMNLLPQVERAEYGQFQYSDILRMEDHHGIVNGCTWKDVERLDIMNMYIECNRHLEAGRRLEDWLPDLPTDFHYNICIDDAERNRASRLLANIPRPIWGISAASYRGSEAWETWNLEAWQDFLERWEALAGGSVLLMGGFWDDLTSALSENGRYHNIVGKTNVPTMISLLEQIDGYIGFSSGMGILRTVLTKPAFMMWPKHQVELSTSWAPREMLEDGRYIASQWMKPREVFALATSWHRSNYGS